MKFKVNASYGVIKTYSKDFEVEANSAEEAEALIASQVEEMSEEEVSTWESWESDIDTCDMAYETVEDLDE